MTEQTETTAPSQETTAETKSETIVGTGTEKTETATVPADWPADWREKLSGGDDKALERLKRSASPNDLWKSYRALEQKVSSGEFKQNTPFPAEGTDEQKNEWRKANSVPFTPADYKIELKNGMVPGEADKPILEEFQKFAHDNNWEANRLNSAIQFYYDLKDKQSAELRELESQQRQKAEDELRTEWGADYRRNTNMVDNFLGSIPDGLGQLLVGGVLADGRKVGDDPRIIRWLARLAGDQPTLVPSSPQEMAGRNQRKLEIQNIMRTDRTKYDREKLGDEYRRILEAEEKDRQRGRAA